MNNLNRKIITVIIVILMLAGESYAAKWQTMTFGEDVSKTLEELNQYCAVHDMKIEDVLWANKTTQSELKAGQVIYLPANHVDMLSIWQNVGAWQPTALVPVNSAAAAKRLTADDNASNKPETSSVKTESEVKPETASVKTEPEVKPEVKPAEVKAPEPEIDLASLSIRRTKRTAPAKIEITPEKPASTEKVAQVTPLTTVQPAKSQTPKTPSNVIRETAKPDKVLTANKNKKKAQTEIPGLMDPIIIFSPNGDPTHGPMRLMISGDKVEVVRLPKNAVPKRPSVADLDHTFGTTPGYLKNYDVSNLPRRNNYVPPNMVRLNGKMLWPVDGRVSSPFGKWRGNHKHQGIDIPMPNGTPIRAANTGIVARTGNNSTMGFRGYGNFVLMDHGGGVQSFYAHCSSVAVREGQRVLQGQIIGYVGSTGRSTANHLHFEIRVNDIKVDPMPYLGGNQRLASTSK